jgi:hypothetical protein
LTGNDPFYAFASVVPAGYPQLDCSAAAYGVIMSNRELMDWAKKYMWLNPAAMFTDRMDADNRAEMHTALSKSTGSA